MSTKFRLYFDRSLSKNYTVMAERTTGIPIRYERTLAVLIKNALITAGEMGHQYATLGHLGAHLPRQYLSALDDQGLGSDYFASTLPISRERRSQKSEMGYEITTLLQSAVRRAEVARASVVSIDHVFDAMTDPSDAAYLTDLRFAGRFSEPLVVLPKTSRETTAA